MQSDEAEAARLAAMQGLGETNYQYELDADRIREQTMEDFGLK